MQIQKYTHLFTAPDGFVRDAEYHAARGVLDTIAAVALGKYLDLVYVGRCEESPALDYGTTLDSAEAFVRAYFADSVVRPHFDTSITLSSIYDHVKREYE